MRTWLVAAGCLIVFAVAGVGWAILRLDSAYPAVTEERVTVTPENRCLLVQLRQEAKFEPHDFPPLGYAGPATPEDAMIMNRAVNGFLDAILAVRGSELAGRDVSSKMKRPIDSVFWLETADRNRVYEYLLEAWYILGFRGATGHFFARTNAEGRASSEFVETLPPGWRSPTEPRLVGGCA